MRRCVKTIAVALTAAIPTFALAAAGIKDTKHDLSSGSAAANKSAATDQTCIFCHTPHKAAATALLWNHAATAVSAGFTGTLTSGTVLPAGGAIDAKSKVCLSCHDGTIALGQVSNAGGGASGTNAVAGAAVTGGKLSDAAYIVGAVNLDGNHPVSIPYAGATYKTIQSKATADGAIGNYYAATTVGCTGGTPVCTTAASVGVNIALYGTNGTDAGIECSSCHEVHNRYDQSYLLRVTPAASALCKACHNK